MTPGETAAIRVRLGVPTLLQHLSFFVEELAETARSMLPKYPVRMPPHPRLTSLEPRILLSASPLVAVDAAILNDGDAGFESAKPTAAQLASLGVATRIDDAGSAQLQDTQFQDAQFQDAQFQDAQLQDAQSQTPGRSADTFDIVEPSVAFSASLSEDLVGALATIVVDTFDDVVDGGDTFMSLREAINSANANDTIHLPVGTYLLDENAGATDADFGDLDISTNIIIEGTDAATTIIDASGLSTPDRVIEILSSGSLSISGVTIQGGDAGNGDGGGVLVNGSLIADNVIFTGNAAREGGGVFLEGVDVQLTNVVLTQNHADNKGGGLRTKLGNATLDRVEVSHNTSDQGGGIYHNDATLLEVINTTLSNNVAVSRGGAIETHDVVEITNSTIAFNDSGGSGAGIQIQGAGSATLANTILFNPLGANSNSNLTSAGNNIDSDGSAGLGDPLDGVDPLLDIALEYHGGFSRSHAIPIQSPARDAGLQAVAPAVDQRGNARVGIADIGAYEYLPTAESVWISTSGNVDYPSGANGLNAWQDGQVLSFGDPNLSLGPGTTAGTLARVFTLDLFADDGNTNVEALHFVSTDITIGSANAIPLQVGDVLFSTSSTELFNGGALTLEPRDVGLFRPTTAGDYSSGTISMLLDDLSPSGGFAGPAVFGVSLVEQTTVFGDTILEAGDFVFTQLKDLANNDVFVFETQDVGEGTTLGTINELIEGSDIGLSVFGSFLRGVEFIEMETTIGGTTLSAGTLLLYSTGTHTVGSNNVATTTFDVFALDVSQTTMVAGTAVVDASILFRGADIGIDTSNERPNALALGPGVEIRNLTPSDIAPNLFSIDENVDTSGGVVLGTLTATDADISENFTWAIDVGGDAAVFSIDGNTGELSLDDGMLDFETKATYTVTVLVTDVANSTYGESITVTVNDVNEAPELSSIETTALSYITGDGAVPITASVVVGDPDDSMIDSATIQIGNNFGSSEDVLSFVDTPSITHVWDGASGILTLAGPDTLANYQAALTSVNYENTSVTPSLATRTVEFTINDGLATSAIAQRDINVITSSHVVVVDTTSDISDGTTTSIGALLADRGADTRISLREAIEAANNTLNGGELDRIHFEIPEPLVAGAHSIVVDVGGLPAITEAVVIDATSDADFGGTPIVELIGSSAGAGMNGLEIFADGSTVRGLVINRFDNYGIYIQASDNTTIVQNYVGTDVTGAIDLGNAREGVRLENSHNNLIGGTTTADRNVISGNEMPGVTIANGSTRNQVQGNYIGLSADGANDLGNAQLGILVNNSANNVIGGGVPGARNVISGNDWSGIAIQGSGSSGNEVRGNYIGLDASGTIAIGNSDYGIDIWNGGPDNNQVGGTNVEDRNVISGNGWAGIHVSSAGTTGNVVQGNYIGTDVTGVQDVGNGSTGGATNNGGIDIDDQATGNVVGGTLTGAGNLIAFNSGVGIRIDGVSTLTNTIQRNSIHSNTDIGIDLISGNDNRQPADITGVTTDGSANITVTGNYADSALGSETLTIEYFSNPSVAQEGATYLGSDTLTTDAAGNGTISHVISANVAVGESVTATVTDSAGNTSEFSLARQAVSPNVPPTVLLANETASLDEDADTSTSRKLADIVVTDDGQGTNTLSLSGADAGLFLIVSGSELHLIAGAGLDFETNPVLDVTVSVDDATIGTTPDDTVDLALPVNDINESPTVTFSPLVSNIFEDADTTSPLVIGTITITDDALGTETLSLSGADAGLFEIAGSNLQLIAGATLDFETNPSLDVNIDVDDATISGAPDGTASHTISVDDVNETPSLNLVPVITTLPESTDTTASIRVADLSVTDDALGTNVLTVAGTHASFFELQVGDTQLHLRAGVTLDGILMPTLDVTVNLDDTSLAGGVEDAQSHSVLVTGGNAPATIALVPTLTNLSEGLDTSLSIKVADVALSDDGVGTNTVTLGGADAAMFELQAGDTELHLRAGVSLDFETNPALDVIVSADDAAIPGGPEDSTAYAGSVVDENEAPSVTVTAMLAAIPEDADTTTPNIVASITVVDDALGTNTLTVAGTYAAWFEIVGTDLRLRANTALDFESQAELDVVVHVDDVGVAGNPDGSAAYSLTVVDVNEPPQIAVAQLVEQIIATDAAGSVVVGTIDIADDALGTVVLNLGGTHAGLFEIIGGNTLAMRANADLTGITTAFVTVTASDPTLVGATDDQVVFSVNVVPAVSAPAPQQPDSVQQDDSSDEGNELNEDNVVPFDPTRGARSIKNITAARRGGILSDQQAATPTVAKTPIRNVASSALVDDGGYGSPASRVAQQRTTASDRASSLSFAALRGPGQLWNQLDAFRKTITDYSVDELIVGSVSIVSSGFTAGYVVWILRGGALLSSLLASVPVWRFVDPMVILSNREDGEDDEGESLQSIFDQAKPDAVLEETGGESDAIHEIIQEQPE